MASSVPNFALNHIAAPGLQLDQFFALAKSLGLEQVEIRNDIEGRPILDGTPAESVKNLASAQGVSIITINALQRFNEWNSTRAKEAETLAEYSKSCGAKALVLVPVNDGSGRANGERQGNLRNALKELAPILARYELLGLVEPLGFEICSLRSKREAIEAIQSLKLTDQFKLVHDTFHHTLAGEQDYFPKETGLVHISGVSDANIGINSMLDAHRVLVDDTDRLGNLEQIATLMTRGYRGRFSFEPFAKSVQSDPDLLSSLKASMNFINRHVTAA